MEVEEGNSKGGSESLTLKVQYVKRKRERFDIKKGTHSKCRIVYKMYMHKEPPRERMRNLVNPFTS